MAHKTTPEEFKVIKLKYNLADCTHFTENSFISFIRNSIITASTHTTNLKDNINNPETLIFWIKFNDDILIQYLKYKDFESIKIISNDILFTYGKTMVNMTTKEYLTQIINIHNLPINNIHLTHITKTKITLLKYYFSIIPDIYKYILPMINNIYTNDPDICMELLFEQDIKYGYKS